MTRFMAWVAALVAFVICGNSAAGADSFGPFAPNNPYTALNGTATMHGDSGSSDASPYPGPGLSSQQVEVNELAAACPAILQGSDGIPVALCTKILGRNPVVYALDPATGSPRASLTLPVGNLFGGVYAYFDRRNRLVVFDSAGNLLRIRHTQAYGGLSLAIDSSISIASALDRRCPSLCGGVVGLAPDWHGRVWFATAQRGCSRLDDRSAARR
jgi:hypothetical protein